MIIADGFSCDGRGARRARLATTRGTVHQTTELHAIVERLLILEEKNLRGELAGEDRQEWVSLCRRILILPEDFIEKRRFLRVTSQRPATVVSPDSDPDAVVVSVGGGGLFVRTSCVPEIGSELLLDVSFPERRTSSRRFRAKVKWVSRGDAVTGEGAGGVGVQFIELDAEQRDAILALQRESLERSMEVTLEKYRFYFANCPDVLLLTDHEGTIRECNEQAVAFLRSSQDDLRGRSLEDWLPEESRKLIQTVLAEAGTEDRSQPCEVTAIRPQDGAERILEVIAVIVRAADLKLGTLLVGRDRTERKRAEDDRRKLEHRLYQADKLASLGRITAGIAHDINNPLAWVLTNLSILTQYVDHVLPLVSQATAGTFGPGEQSEQEVLQEIQNELGVVVSESLDGVERIRDIIRDLRVFSRFEKAGEREVDVNDAMEATLRLLRNQLKQTAHVVREYGELPPTYLNYGRVCQVLMNLVANATTAFNAPDAGRNRIVLKTSVEDGEIVVSITDNGRGIPAHVQDKIFDPFFTLRRDEGGTGLGLSIVRDSLQTLGGGVSLHSQWGKGSTFTVRLPVRPSPSVPPMERVPSSAPAPVKPRLFVIDDEEKLLRACARSLGGRWKVTCVSTAAQALPLLMAGDFDVALCDVMMPGGTGTALVSELAKLDPEKAARVIFMTGGIFDDRERELLESLTNTIIEKPFNMTEIEALLLEVTGR